MFNKAQSSSKFFELSKFRRRFVLMILLTLFTSLISRSFYLQGMQTDFLQKKGQATSNRTEALHAYRGKILDRNNEILAISAPRETIWANPPEVVMNLSQKKELSRLLKLRLEHLDQRFS